jgi:hypothetical protein
VGERHVARSRRLLQSALYRSTPCAVRA